MAPMFEFKKKNNERNNKQNPRRRLPGWHAFGGPVMGERERFWLLKS